MAFNYNLYDTMIQDIIGTDFFNGNLPAVFDSFAAVSGVCLDEANMNFNNFRSYDLRTMHTCCAMVQAFKEAFRRALHGALRVAEGRNLPRNSYIPQGRLALANYDAIQGCLVAMQDIRNKAFQGLPF